MEVRNERPCGNMEFWARRFVSGLLYWRAYRQLYPGSPYFVPQAIKRLDRFLSHKTVLFEWGSGQSTLWFAQRAGRMISIEHDPLWFERISTKLTKSSLNPNIDYRLVPPDPKAGDFSTYVHSITSYPDGYFDVVSVDGRERVECVTAAKNKVKGGGLLILDDSHRPRYSAAFQSLAGWPFQRYDFGMLQTTIFVCPTEAAYPKE